MCSLHWHTHTNLLWCLGVWLRGEIRICLVKLLNSFGKWLIKVCVCACACACTHAGYFHLLIFRACLFLQLLWRSTRTSLSIRLGSTNTQMPVSLNHRNTVNMAHTQSGSPGKLPEYRDNPKQFIFLPPFSEPTCFVTTWLGDMHIQTWLGLK